MCTRKEFTWTSFIKMSPIGTKSSFFKLPRVVIITLNTLYVQYIFTITSKIVFSCLFILVYHVLLIVWTSSLNGLEYINKVCYLL